jgi:hypothetical protein
MRCHAAVWMLLCPPLRMTPSYSHALSRCGVDAAVSTIAHDTVSPSRVSLLPVCCSWHWLPTQQHVAELWRTCGVHSNCSVLTG